MKRTSRSSSSESTISTYGTFSPGWARRRCSFEPANPEELLALLAGVKA